MKDLNYIIEHSKLDIDKKNKNGEVFTPIQVINNMLDTLPKDVWNNSELKWLDPSAGIANFPFIIYERLMDGLKNKIKNKNKRTKHILTNMIYMVELDENNCNHIKEVFGNNKINLYEGSYFDYKPDIIFNIIVGNPPYNKGGINNNKKKDINELQKRSTIWPLFILKAFEMLTTSGYLLFINPLTWLRDNHKIHNLLFEKNIIYLELWEDTYALKHIKAKIPLSIFLLQNIETNNLIEKIKIFNLRQKYIKEYDNFIIHKNISLPLAYLDELTNLRMFIINNNCLIKYNVKISKDTLLQKSYEKHKNQLIYMTRDDIKKIKADEKYSIDFFANFLAISNAKPSLFS
jgi:hypothetical protein